jgi:hypothetical protein
MSLYDFKQAFCDYDRDYFSDEGYDVLFNMFLEIAPEADLDVIAVCCDYTEYETDSALLDDYGYLIDYDEDHDDIDDAMYDLKNELEADTYFVALDNGHYLLQSF